MDIVIITKPFFKNRKNKTFMLYEQTRVIINNSFPREYELAKILPIEPGVRVAHAISRHCACFIAGCCMSIAGGIKNYIFEKQCAIFHYFVR